MSKRERTISLENSVASLNASVANAEPEVPYVVIVCDIDQTIKTGGSVLSSPAVTGMNTLLDRLQKWYNEVIKGASPTPSRKPSNLKPIELPPKAESETEDSEVESQQEEEEGKTTSPGGGAEVCYLSNRWGPMRFARLGPEGFLSANSFPKGRLITRTWSDFLGFVSKTPYHKAAQLNGLLKGATHCVLIGDSTENDMLVYLEYLHSKASKTLKENAVVAIRMIQDDHQERMDKLIDEKGMKATKIVFWKEAADLQKGLEALGMLC